VASARVPALQAGSQGGSFSGLVQYLKVQWGVNCSRKTDVFPTRIGAKTMMDSCEVVSAITPRIECIGKLVTNGENVCTATLRISVKPGSGWLRNQPVPLTGKEYLLEADQFQIGTRVPGDNTNPHGILFSGFKQGIEVGRAPDGSPTYTLVVNIAFNDQRVSKNPGFRRCETNGTPLRASGHVYLGLRS
jgi:hypothetical protein